MIFRKKRKMIDVRELQRRGVVRIPKNSIPIQTNREGFVDLRGNKTLKNATPPTSNSELFGFMSPSTDAQPQKFSTESDGYNKREVDTKITDLDNKIYKLENRIELLEKKIGINQSSNSSVGVMGW